LHKQKKGRGLIDFH